MEKHPGGARPEIDPGQAHLTPEFFIGGLSEKRYTLMILVFYLSY
jgi:hypothetical protein